MVTSPFEWKILDWEETTQTNKLTNKQTFFFSQAANHPFSYRYVTSMTRAQLCSFSRINSLYHGLIYCRCTLYILYSIHTLLKLKRMIFIFRVIFEYRFATIRNLYTGVWGDPFNYFFLIFVLIQNLE